ncbi:hypothetical protein [Photobacterium salinisoli]|uniref:hypothetical protein n=1 Tax=Photobacterium salinisoli TaxID=1616783 RepID=UPI000EA1EA7E|nr:hypothetical protein [Photobacterium salinisoli]
MNEKTSILFESLKRTDTFINSADLKASFTLAAGITFLGIYASIFYNIATSDELSIPAPYLLSVLGLVLVPWVIWFIKVKKVFTPNVKSSTNKSIISFASIIQTHESLEEFKQHYTTIKEQDNIFTQSVENDLLENHWICSDICMQKMNSFKSSLTFFWLSLVSSLLGISLLLFISQVNLIFELAIMQMT